MPSLDGIVPSIAVKLKGSVVMTTIKKTYRTNQEVDKKIKELLKTYRAKSENELFEMIINDIYELKKSKALIPFEEFKERDLQLQKALLEIGKLQGVLQEKEKQLEEQKEQNQKENKKGFWARLFGG